MYHCDFFFKFSGWIGSEKRETFYALWDTYLLPSLPFVICTNRPEKACGLKNSPKERLIGRISVSKQYLPYGFVLPFLSRRIYMSYRMPGRKVKLRMWRANIVINAF